MSKSRAKKKQRRRARETALGETTRRTPGPTEGPAAKVGPVAPAGPDAPVAPQRHPSRLEVRDGVPRPDAIWAPFPLSEIGMAAGLVMFGIGFAGGSPAMLVAGVGVLVVVVAELCLREHFRGFRSHSILLAMLPVTVAHLALVAAGIDWRGPLALAVDLALAGGLAWWLHGRFTRAQGYARLGARRP